jgi:hypothetical protein
MFKKILMVAAPVTATLGALLAPLAHAQMTPADLAANIDKVASTTQTYFGVLITNGWPYILGALVLVGFIVFGRGIITRLFGK